MNARSPLAPSAPAPTDDYTYEMRVEVPRPKVLAAVTDDTEIARWWTVVTGSEHEGNDVRLFVGDRAPFVFFTIEQAPGAGEVAWNVTDCAVMDDWVGTVPSFSVRANDDGTCTLAFRHVGLTPQLECFDQCRAGWNHFMPSLHQYLETGTGRPNEPRDPSA